MKMPFKYLNWHLCLRWHLCCARCNGFLVRYGLNWSHGQWWNINIRRFTDGLALPDACCITQQSLFGRLSIGDSKPSYEGIWKQFAVASADEKCKYQVYVSFGIGNRDNIYLINIFINWTLHLITECGFKFHFYSCLPENYRFNVHEMCFGFSKCFVLFVQNYNPITKTFQNLLLC